MIRYSHNHTTVNFNPAQSNYFSRGVDLFQKKRLLLLLLCVIVFFWSRNSLHSSRHSGGSITDTSAQRPHLIFEETFEGNAYFPLKGSTLNRTETVENNSLDWALSTVEKPVFQGKKACRFEIRKDQPLVGTSQRIRSEVVIIKGTEDERFTPDIWYSFAILFPKVGMEYSDKRDCINQWFEDGSQETTLRVEKDKAFLEVCPAEGSRVKLRYDLFAPDLKEDDSVKNMVAIPKDVWHEFVFHFIHAKDSTGLIEVWRDGLKIHEIHGRNMHLQYPKWKVGLYNAKLKETENYSRVLYFDNIRVGRSASLSEMSSLKTTN